MSDASLTGSAGTGTMEAAKAAVLRVYEIISTGAVEHAAEVIHPEYVTREGDGDRPGGIEGFQMGITRLRSSFSDLHVEVLEIIAENDRVAVRTRASGTHDGSFNGIPPTGKPVSIQQIQFFRIEDGLIAEHWACREEVKLMRQIGAIPGR